MPPPPPFAPGFASPSSRPCVERGSFSAIDFSTALLARSNLGGQGGRCDAVETAAGMCLAIGRDSNTPHELYFSGVGRDGLDLRITNESEYRAWRSVRNGIKIDGHGAHGVVNLLGPRAVGATHGHAWDSTMTFADLRFTFVSAGTGTARVLSRVFMSIYDLEVGHGGETECAQVRGATLELHRPTEVTARLEDAFLDDQLGANSTLASQWSRWGAASPVYCGSTGGAGADNPTDPYALTPLQQGRSLLLTLINTSSFDVRFAVAGAQPSIELGGTCAAWQPLLC